MPTYLLGKPYTLDLEEFYDKLMAVAVQTPHITSQCSFCAARIISSSG